MAPIQQPLKTGIVQVFRGSFLYLNRNNELVKIQPSFSFIPDNTDKTTV